eukprot:SAG31_NODE_3373_length_4351_cov_2.070790_2_plen_189_part_00
MLTPSGAAPAPYISAHTYYMCSSMFVNSSPSMMRLSWATRDESVGFPTDRNTNYNIANHSHKWAQFVAFDKAQFDEIQQRYSPDIYWLDAGWVGAGEQYLPLADWATAHRKTNPAQLWVNRDGGVVEVGPSQSRTFLCMGCPSQISLDCGYGGLSDSREPTAGIPDGHRAPAPSEALGGTASCVAISL